MDGYPDGTFGPDRNMTRAEVAQMFYALLNDQNVPATVSFSDVPDGAWYADAVETLASLGMFTGYPDGTFHPNSTITRLSSRRRPLLRRYGSQCPVQLPRCVRAGLVLPLCGQRRRVRLDRRLPRWDLPSGEWPDPAEACAVLNRMLGRTGDSAQANN